MPSFITRLTRSRSGVGWPAVRDTKSNWAAVWRGAPKAYSVFRKTVDWSLVSTPFCPRCGDSPHCGCPLPDHDAASGRTAVPAQFDREWVRPYVSLHESAPGNPPAATTSSTGVWAVPDVGHESGPPVVITRAAGHRRPEPPRRRRPLRLTAALATLIGSAAITGAYAFSRDQDTRGAASPPPASRLDVDEVDESPGIAPGPTPPRATPPSGAQRTAPVSGQSPPGTASSAVPSATDAAASSAPAVSAAPPGGPQQDRPRTAPSPGAPSAPPDAPTLLRHDTGPGVQDLQHRLAQVGAWTMPQRGVYDRHLQDAVAGFQAKHGVRGDPPGVYGPATRRLLESLTA
ncbi:peptidoglycan-binding protein [Streptomyces lavendulae]|uniref:peptidoglycan-binding domain-containing protein n=1 Tax=Streptomyces lavendulae TaxID=1914 RepID=UPI0038227054